MLDFGILGTPRKHRPDACSKCGVAIADDAVPLMLFADDKMWAYCENCEQKMFHLLKPHERSRDGEKEIQAGE